MKPLKYLECRAEAIRQFITTKSLVSIHSQTFNPSNISPHNLGLLNVITYKREVNRETMYDYVQCTFDDRVIVMVSNYHLL